MKIRKLFVGFLMICLILMPVSAALASTQGVSGDLLGNIGNQGTNSSGTVSTEAFWQGNMGTAYFYARAIMH